MCPNCQKPKYKDHEGLSLYVRCIDCECSYPRFYLTESSQHIQMDQKEGLSKFIEDYPDEAMLLDEGGQ